MKRVGAGNDEKKMQEVIVGRIKTIDNLLKDKFSSQWRSVRKAFLDLDKDHDGFITP